MKETLSLSLSQAVLSPYQSRAGLQKELAALGLDGIEGVWAMEPIPVELIQGTLVGYHLTFFTDWLDLYREDHRALREKFGSLEQAEAFYGGLGPDFLLDFYREDLARAKALGAQYLVFHVSDVSMEESYTYRWRHSSEEVLDAAAEVVNALLAEEKGDFDFLMENQWWPGLTLTDPALTARLLEAVRYPKKGLLLDTGHLLHCNPALETEEEAVAYIHRVLDAQGELCSYIRGIHLHQSLSGAYVRAHTGALPADFPQEPVERFGCCYGHILQIDRHQPWTTPAVASVIQRLGPDYLTHELSASSALARHQAVLTQRRAFGYI